MPPKMYIKNPEELHRAFQKIDKLKRASALEAAVKAGLQPINNAAIQKAPYLTGTLRRSIHTEIVESRESYCEGASGTNLDYAARIEFGYNDTDALGRTYHQPAQPYLRPAFDEQRGNAIDEMRDALNDVLMNLI